MFEEIISIENLLAAWREFARGKRHKRDVVEFSYRLMDNLLALHEELKIGTYRHGGYYAFKISDPKPRDIHKATVRDRLVHHALYRKLYPFFNRTWIADSYSCRLKAKHYIRYADDFVILSESREELTTLIPAIRDFLNSRLKLDLHPDKLYVKTVASGLDFLGWVHFPDHRVLRGSSRRRIVRHLAEDRNQARVASYRGLLGHGNAHKLSTRYLSKELAS